MSFLSSEGAGSTSSSQQQATLSQQQATLSQQQATLSQQQATLSQQQATLSQQQATLSQQQALTSLRKLMPIYEFVAAHGRYNDSKTIVDMPLRGEVDEFVRSFEATVMGQSDMDEGKMLNILEGFIGSWMLPAGSDSEVADLEMPGSSAQLASIAKSWGDMYGDWAQSLMGGWRMFSRKVNDVVLENPSRCSLLAVPHPFIIPGERFRESYYWDSYWIVKGLLVSGQVEMALGILRNFSYMVHSIGHVPNGFRSYYLNRSQPPLLATMVSAVYEHEGSLGVLSEFLPTLVREMRFWRNQSRTLAVTSQSGRTVTCSRYFSSWTAPRPESLKEDIHTFEEMLCEARSRDSTFRISKEDKEKLFRNIAAAAESGWDFSSRWLSHPMKLHTIQTTSILPVDLNAILLKSERLVSQFAGALGEESLRAEFETLAEERCIAMREIFWDENAGRWRDVVFEQCHGGYRAIGFASSGEYASDWVPLWCDAVDHVSNEAQRAIESLKRSKINARGGIAASNICTGQQWDWPNAWPPLQYMLAEGCMAVGGKEGANLGKDIIRRFLTSSYEAWKKNGTLPEKFDCTCPGSIGYGGEYKCVEGFGWTIGLVLTWLASQKPLP